MSLHVCYVNKDTHSMHEDTLHMTKQSRESRNVHKLSVYDK